WTVITQGTDGINSVLGKFLNPFTVFAPPAKSGHAIIQVDRGGWMKLADWRSVRYRSWPRCRQREALIDGLQRAEASQSQIENPLLNGGIIQHFDDLPAADANTHLFTRREGDGIDAHRIKMIDPFLRGKEIFFFSITKPQGAQAERVSAEDTFISKTRDDPRRALRERAKC